LMIALALTASSGISFAAGSRLRAPLEAIIPLLSAVSLVRAIRSIPVTLRLGNVARLRRFVSDARFRVK
jgi:hypothetical protein